MKKYRLTAVLLSLSLLFSVVTACGSTADKSDDSAEETAEETGAINESAEEETEAEEIDFDSEENTIRVGTRDGQLRTALNILAYELGYYEEEGVNVEFVNITGTEALTAITTNKSDVDVLATSLVPDLTFIANGSDLVIFEGTAVEGGAIISLPENEDYYKDLSNYGDATIAMIRGESSWTVSRNLLAEAGVDVDNLNIIYLDSEVNVVQAVVKGEADVGFLPMEYASQSLDLGIVMVYEVGELEPEYVCCRQVTSSTKLEEKYDAFVKYTIANLRAWEYFEDEDNREDVIAILAEHSGQDADYVEEYLFTNRTKLSLDPNEYGVIDYYNSLIDMGYFEGGTDVDVADHIDTSLYAEALQTVLERDPENEFFLDKVDLYREYNNAVF